MLLRQPSYSPNFVSADFFSLSNIEKKIKEHISNNKKNILKLKEKPFWMHKKKPMKLFRQWGEEGEGNVTSI